MAENMSKSRRFKLIASMIIPVAVIIITIIMVSVSFAWFSQDAVPSVQTIELNVAKSFILTFTSTQDSSTRNINYKGQNAIDSNGRLRTEYNGQTYGGFGTITGGLQQYMLDSPYYFITTITLDTEDADIDMSMFLDTVRITSGNTTMNSYDSGTGGFSVDDIPYVFTWYFKEHDEENPAVNYIGESVDDKNSAMNYALPVDGEVWYTPYGKLTFDGNHLVKQVGDTAVGSDYSLLAGGLKDVRFHAEKQGFDFYIVFAPEKLFWAQFSAADRNMTVDKPAGNPDSGLYSSDELKKIFGTGSKNQMYYSNTSYYGATFEFGATLRVTTIYKPEAQQTPQD